MPDTAQVAINDLIAAADRARPVVEEVILKAGLVPLQDLMKEVHGAEPDLSADAVREALWQLLNDRVIELTVSRELKPAS